MNPLLSKFLLCAGAVSIGEVSLGAVLSLIAHAGSVGRRVANAFAHAPLLDVWVAGLTWVPWIVACLFAGWIGLPAAILGQMIGLGLWCFGHELAHREAARGPRIVKFVNRSVGRWRNHLALWVTLLAVPGFWFIRFLEVFVYWSLVALLDFPHYRQSEWVNVSRHKFDGLVGHDLVWCLYCDWMTGVYSLGAEMLRNVESFWCPIRFYDGKKCANCRADFPDIDGGWVPANATMAEVVEVMEQQYGGGRREWFGHPARLTVKGKPLDTTAEALAVGGGSG
jgi:hypothetical protein